MADGKKHKQYLFREYDSVHWLRKIDYYVQFTYSGGCHVSAAVPGVMKSLPLSQDRPGGGVSGRPRSHIKAASMNYKS